MTVDQVMWVRWARCLAAASLVAACMWPAGVAGARVEVARTVRFAGPLVVTSGRVFWVERPPGRFGNLDTGFLVKSAIAGGPVTEVMSVPPTPHPGYQNGLESPVLLADATRVALDVYTEGQAHYSGEETSISDELWTAPTKGGPAAMLVRCAPTATTGLSGEGARRLTGLAGDELAYYDGCGPSATEVVRSFAADGSSSTEHFDAPDRRVDDLLLSGHFAAWKETADDNATALVIRDRSTGADAYRLPGATVALGLQPDGKTLFRTSSTLAWASVEQPYGHETGLGPPLGFAADSILGRSYEGGETQLGMFSLASGLVRPVVSAARIGEAASDGRTVAWTQQSDQCLTTGIYTQSVGGPTAVHSQPPRCPARHLVVRTSRLVLRSSGDVPIRLRCNAGHGACRGTLILRDRFDVPLIAPVSFRIAPGTDRVVRVRLLPVQNRRVRRVPRLKVQIEASLADRDDAYATTALRPGTLVYRACSATRSTERVPGRRRCV